MIQSECFLALPYLYNLRRYVFLYFYPQFHVARFILTSNLENQQNEKIVSFHL